MHINSPDSITGHACVVKPLIFQRACFPESHGMRSERANERVHTCLHMGSSKRLTFRIIPPFMPRTNPSDALNHACELCVCVCVRGGEGSGQAQREWRSIEHDGFSSRRAKRRPDARLQARCESTMAAHASPSVVRALCSRLESIAQRHAECKPVCV